MSFPYPIFRLIPDALKLCNSIAEVVLGAGIYLLSLDEPKLPGLNGAVKTFACGVLFLFWRLLQKNPENPC